MMIAQAQTIPVPIPKSVKRGSVDPLSSDMEWKERLHKCKEGKGRKFTLRFIASRLALPGMVEGGRICCASAKLALNVECADEVRVEIDFSVAHNTNPRHVRLGLLAQFSQLKNDSSS